MVTTFEDMIEAAVDMIRRRGYSDPAMYQKVRNAINRYYSDMHSLFRISSALVEDSGVTWSSGNSLDPTSQTTNWCGRVLMITSSGESYPWYEVDIRDLINRRSVTTTNEGNEYESEGGVLRRVFAVEGSKIYVVNSISDTLTIWHYQKPSKLSNPSDEPLLPTQWRMIPVYGAVRDVISEAIEAGLLSKRSKGEEEAAVMFAQLWDGMKQELNRRQEMKHKASLGPVGEAAVAMMNWRRRNWRGWNQYQRKW